MTQTIELTAAEMELINSQRRVEAELAAQKLVQAEIAFEKAKTDARNYVRQVCEKFTAHHAATEKYAMDLGANYSLVSTSKTESRIANKYDDNHNVIDSFEVSDTYPYSVIKHGDYTIIVNEHITWSKSKYYSKPTNQGYKMYVNGPGIDWKTSNRGYTNVKKVASLIDGAIAAEVAKLANAQKQKSAVEQVVAELAAQYPTAEITSKRDYYKTALGHNKSKYVDYDAVIVKFENGISVKYRVYGDKSLGRMGVEFPYVEPMALIDALSNVTF